MKTAEMKFRLQLFAEFPDESKRNTQVTTQSSMSPTMKTFYDTALLENSRETNVFSQFAKKQPMFALFFCAIWWNVAMHFCKTWLKTQKRLTFVFPGYTIYI